MTTPGFLGLGDLDGHAAAGGDTIDSGAQVGRVKNGAVGTPIAADSQGSIANDLRLPAGHIDPFQLTVAPQERNMPAVRRPEWKHGVFRAGQGLGFQLVERPQPQHRSYPAHSGRQKRLRAIGRDAHLPGQPGFGGDGEPDGLLVRGRLRENTARKPSGSPRVRRLPQRSTGSRAASRVAALHSAMPDGLAPADPPQFARQVAGRLPALVRILGQAGPYTRSRRPGSVQAGDRRRLCGQNRRDQAGLACAFETPCARSASRRARRRRRRCRSARRLPCLRVAPAPCTGRCPRIVPWLVRSRVSGGGGIVAPALRRLP